ncbi:hypothetical protein QQ045_010227 [Rhodiola kirilowii]
MSSRRAREMWQMRNFKECLVDCGLSDLNYKGDPFTYTNRRKGEQEVRARLDRAVANQKWRELFPQAVVKHGFSYTSDHLPIILYLEEEIRDRHSRMPKFEPMWIRHEQFKETVSQAWNS